MDRLTTTTRLLEKSRSTIYTSGHSTGETDRKTLDACFHSEKHRRLQHKLIQYIHKGKYSIIFCCQFQHNLLHLLLSEKLSDIENFIELELPQTDSKLSLSLLLLRIRKLGVPVFTRSRATCAASLNCCTTTAHKILCRLLSHCTYVTLGRGCWCVTVYLVYACGQTMNEL